MKARNKINGDIVNFIKTENNEFPYKVFGFAISEDRFNKLYTIIDELELFNELIMFKPTDNDMMLAKEINRIINFINKQLTK